MKSKILNNILVLVGIIIMAVAAYGLYGIFSEYQEAVNKYDDLEHDFVKFSDEKDDASVTGVGGEIPWYEYASVDVAAIRDNYPDVVGWIMFENEDISYPLLHATDNDTYLYASYDKTYSKSGSIFVETTNSSDFSDPHTIIYGHNMKNLSMFGRLKYYRQQNDYYEDHMYFQIFTEDEILRYQIFAYQECPVTSIIYKLEEQDTNYSAFLSEVRANSLRSTDIPVTEADKMITLSTCTASDEKRFVVNAVLVDTYSYEMENN